MDETRRRLQLMERIWKNVRTSASLTGDRGLIEGIVPIGDVYLARCRATLDAGLDFSDPNQPLVDVESYAETVEEYARIAFREDIL